MNTELNLYNKEAEIAVLGCFLVDANAFRKTEDIITSAEDFMTLDHKLIYKAICDVYYDINDTDPVKVAKRLDDTGDLNRVGGSDYLYELQAPIVETDSVVHYAEIIKDLSIRRKLCRFSNHITQLSNDTNVSTDSIITEVTQFDTSDIRCSINPIDVLDKAPAPQFPDNDSIFYGHFKHFLDAYWNRNEICRPYLLAGALSEVGVILGRRACVSIGRTPTKRYRIYPNFYSCLVGDTNITRKSTWLNQVKYDLFENDDEKDILMLDSVASAEGLVEAMSYRDDGSTIEIRDGDFEEGRRVLLHPDEIKSLFLVARRSSTNTIIPKITEAYHCPRYMSVQTRQNACKAWYPVLNIFGATTGEWLQDSVTISDLHGGFINRFCYWIYEFVCSKPEPKDPRDVPLEKWYNALERLRDSSNHIRNFVLSPEAWEIYESDYDQHRIEQWRNKDSIETSAAARKMVHTFKIALVFSAVSNKIDDNKISEDAYTTARTVSEYLSESSAYLFGTAGASEAVKQEQIILEKLGELNNRCKRRDLQRKIGVSHMDSETFNRRLDALCVAGVIDIRDKIITRISK